MPATTSGWTAANAGMDRGSIPTGPVNPRSEPAELPNCHGETGAARAISGVVRHANRPKTDSVRSVRTVRRIGGSFHDGEGQGSALLYSQPVCRPPFTTAMNCPKCLLRKRLRGPRRQWRCGTKATFRTSGVPKKQHRCSFAEIAAGRENAGRNCPFRICPFRPNGIAGKVIFWLLAVMATEVAARLSHDRSPLATGRVK